MKHIARKKRLLPLLSALITLPLLLFIACTPSDPTPPTDPETTAPVTIESTTQPETQPEESTAADENTTAQETVPVGESTSAEESTLADETMPTDEPPTDDTTAEETPPTETQPPVTDTAHSPVRKETPMCENITLNAYLIPMMTQELRDEMLQLCKDADIDILSHVYVNQPWVSSDHTFAWYKQAMADADRYGLKLLTRDQDVQNALNKSDGDLRKLAERYKDLPGFGGFFVIDEPYNPTPYARVENIFREICPDAYVNVNFLPGAAYPSRDVYLRQLCDYGGLLTSGGTLSMDCYCFPEGGGVNEHGLFTNYEDLRTAGLYTNTNTAVYVQSVGMVGGYRTPSGTDLRYNMMAALAYGIKEIKFFTWGTPTTDEGNYTTAILDRDNKPTELYYEVVKINKKIHAIGTHLAACDASYVYHSLIKTAGIYEIIPDGHFVQTEGKADVILSMLEERRGNGEYVFVVNKNITAEQTVTLTFTGLSTVYLVSDESGELTETALTDGKLTLTLAAGDGVLIKLPEGDFIRPQEKTDKNLALHAPVTATSSVSMDNYYIYNLTDGIVDSANAARVTAKRGENQLLTVDLGRVETINRIDLYPAGVGTFCGALSPTDFSLLVSADGVIWTEVANNTEPLPRDYVPVFRFESIEARYVRICIRGLKGSNGYADIGELMVYNDDGSIPDKIQTTYTEVDLTEGVNIALNKPVVDYSSTTDVPEWTCHHTYITDGDYTKAWASELFRNERASSKEWITIDLLDVYDINCVKLTPRDVWNGVNVFPEDYEIQVSVDGVNFVTAKSVKGDNDPQTQDPRILTFDLVPARYVRLYATRLTKSSTANGGYAIEINEMEVFGQAHDPDLQFPAS